MNFNILKEIIAMLELMDKSKTVKHFLWFLAVSAVFIATLWLLPNVGDFISTMRK